MSIQKSYNEWASQYDSNQNKTRDLEAIALRELLLEICFDACLEIGCGTGKNTAWLQQKAARLTAVDFSEGMLAMAKEKIITPHVQFVQADITHHWTFAQPPFYDLVTFSLVLEHIDNLDFIFQQATAVLKVGAYMYIGELHPYKQYIGSKARYETDEGTQALQCYTHHTSEFINLARTHGFELTKIKEYMDEDTALPRILAMLFVKQE